jgi:hypothetical protein
LSDDQKTPGGAFDRDPKGVTFGSLVRMLRSTLDFAGALTTP